MKKCDCKVSIVNFDKKTLDGLNECFDFNRFIEGWAPDNIGPAVFGVPEIV